MSESDNGELPKPSRGKEVFYGNPERTLRGEASVPIRGGVRVFGHPGERETGIPDVGLRCACGHKFRVPAALGPFARCPACGGVDVSVAGVPEGEGKSRFDFPMRPSYAAPDDAGATGHIVVDPVGTPMAISDFAWICTNPNCQAEFDAPMPDGCNECRGMGNSAPWIVAGPQPSRKAQPEKPVDGPLPAAAAPETRITAMAEGMCAGLLGAGVWAALDPTIRAVFMALAERAEEARPI